MIYVYYMFVCLAHILASPFLLFLSLRQKYKHSIFRRFFTPHVASSGSVILDSDCETLKNSRVLDSKKSDFKGNFENLDSKKSTLKKPQYFYNFWFHACSFGEITSLKKIIESVPKTKSILVTTITQTGFNQAYNLYGDSKNIAISYLPFESLLPFFAPKCEKLLVFEAELWLMLFFIAKKGGAKTKLINARISTRSARRYKKLHFFYKYLFSYVDSILAQSSIDKERLQNLGAKNIEIIGNIKALNPITPTRFYTKPTRLIVIAASTHKGEEESILAGFRDFLSKCGASRCGVSKCGARSKVQSNENIESKDFIKQDSKNTDLEDSFFNQNATSHLDSFYTIAPATLQSKNKDSTTPLFIIAPRHPERFDEVYNLCKKYFKTQRFSEIDSKKIQDSKSLSSKTSSSVADINFQNLDCEVLLIDTLGELVNLYAISDIVILGGAFAKVGGHNPLEVAAFENVLITGREIFNQIALFECVKNYYVIESNQIAEILKNYKSLQISNIAHKTSDVIDKILC